MIVHYGLHPKLCHVVVSACICLKLFFSYHDEQPVFCFHFIVVALRVCLQLKRH